MADETAENLVDELDTLLGGGLVRGKAVLMEFDAVA